MALVEPHLHVQSASVTFSTNQGFTMHWAAKAKCMEMRNNKQETLQQCLLRTQAATDAQDRETSAYNEVVLHASKRLRVCCEHEVGDAAGNEWCRWIKASLLIYENHVINNTSVKYEAGHPGEQYECTPIEYLKWRLNVIHKVMENCMDTGFLPHSSSVGMRVVLADVDTDSEAEDMCYRTGCEGVTTMSMPAPQGPPGIFFRPGSQAAGARQTAGQKEERKKIRNRSMASTTMVSGQSGGHEEEQQSHHNEIQA